VSGGGLPGSCVMAYRYTLTSVIPGRREAPSPESMTPVPAMAYYVYLLASKKHGTL
jgi:hypothetical protein